MSSQHIQAAMPGLLASYGHAASLRKVASDRLARFGRAVWQALEAYGERRADRELLALSETYRDINPKLSRELRSYVRGGSTF